MTDQADTEYRQPQHEDIPFVVKPPPGATLNGKKPDAHVPRPWPLAARLAVGVLVICMAAGVAASLMAIDTVSARASQASRLADSEAVSLAAMGRQLAAVQAKVATPAPKLRLPASLQHYGICVSFSRNTGNGDLVDVNLSAPQVVAGSYGCGQGTFVSAVPGS